jgi:hypothetical protein
VIPAVKLMVCHGDNEFCGVTEYGKILDEGFRQLGQSLQFTSYRVLEQVVPRKGEVLFVHFEHGLLLRDTLYHLLRIRKGGMKVVLCCHYFDAFTLKRFGAMVDHFVLHRPYPEMGTDRRVSIIPHACPAYNMPDRSELRAKYNVPQDADVFTTFGFLVSWKRLPELIWTLAERLPERAYLQVLTSHHFSGRNEAEEREIRSILEPLKDRSFFTTEFLDQRTISDRLALSDLGFVFHPIHTGSVSGVTKQFVSSRCPVVMTHSSHSSDLRDGVVRVPSFYIGKFVNAILDVDEQQRKALRVGMECEYNRLKVTTIAERYLNLFWRLL